MSYVGSSNRREVLGTRFEKNDNLAFLRQEGHQVPPASTILPQQQPSFFKP
jgi:hypothetical protein